MRRTLVIGLASLAACAAPGVSMPPETGTLLSVQDGDRACYLQLETAPGEVVSVMASFDLCGPSEAVGQRVRLTYERAQVMAMSCEGDPSCEATETVWLAVAMGPAE